jgi:hypothetical protein
MAPSQPDPPFFLAFKNGSLAAAHTHLDLNHVSVAVDDTMVVRDLGSRPYPADYFDSKKRNLYYEISTAGHNTVLVGGRGQVPGKAGALKGPFEGERFTALVGVADDAYEVKTPRARRHLVFVDKSYFVLLDEIEVAEPAPVEVRFHSYGSISRREQGGWTVSENKVSVDIVPALRLASGTVEASLGWTKPVNVLRVGSTAGGRRFLMATALVPSTATELKGVAVAQRIDADVIRVDVGRDQLTWRCGPDGCEFRGVGGR